MSTEGFTLHELRQAEDRIGSIDDEMNDEEYTAHLSKKLEQAQFALRDIISGCDGMLQPALNVTGAQRGFIEEVKRVARSGLV